jgi:hypothetical protein
MLTYAGVCAICRLIIIATWGGAWHAHFARSCGDNRVVLGRRQHIPVLYHRVYVSIRQHTSAYVSILYCCTRKASRLSISTCACRRMRTPRARNARILLEARSSSIASGRSPKPGNPSSYLYVYIQASRRHTCTVYSK